MNNKRQNLEYGFLTVFTMLTVMLIMGMFLGNDPLSWNAYNTYALQADSWRQGRLDLGQDYPWLELAIYNGKYYCSFPPFPSYVLFPFTFIFGSNTPDFAIMYAVNIIITVYLYKLALKLGLEGPAGMFLTVFVTVGANTLFIMQQPSVWFLAQLMCFAGAVLAIYCAVAGKGGWSLFWWACSVGCRPMQILFLPVLLVFLFRYERALNKEKSAIQLLLGRLYWVIPMGVVAASYMVLNYLRFGSVVEFGHNYLPEFVRAEDGQFHIDYMWSNLKSLLQLPEFNSDGAMVINHFGNLNFMLVSPIVLATILGFVYVIRRKEWGLVRLGSMVLILSSVYLLITTMHKTMGAWQFGNRYAIGILPCVYLLVGMISAKFPRLIKFYVPFCVFGICINVVGTVIVYNGLG